MDAVGMETGDQVSALAFMKPVVVAQVISGSGRPRVVQARMSKVLATGLYWCARYPVDALTPAPADVVMPPPAQACVLWGPLGLGVCY